MATDWADSRAKISQAVDVLSQDGSINVIANGRERQIDVSYVGGLGGDTGSRQGNVLTLVPEYRALWPYWYDINPKRQLVDLSTAATGVKFPILFPLYFGTAGYSASFSLTAGDVPSPWTCQIYGPFTRVQLSKLRTGETIDVQVGVNDRETLNISTYPGERRLQVDTAGGLKDVLSGITANSVFWTIGPGLTTCAIKITSTTPNRVAVFNWKNYYKGSN